MVCKKSLYCLKNGPCANYQIRKQIWEDNIRFRESLRNLNRSDHYWSFQVTNNEFSDLDEPSYYKRKNGCKLKACNDCASITHESSDSANVKCLCNERRGSNEKALGEGGKAVQQDEEKNSDGLSKEVQANLPNEAVKKRLSGSRCAKATKNVAESGMRHSKCTNSAMLHPSSKVKFSSQSTLFQPKQSVGIRRCPSMDVIAKDKNISLALSQNVNKKLEINRNCRLKDNVQERCSRQVAEGELLSNVKAKGNLLGFKDVKIPPWLSGPPISRTTRRKIAQERQAPFATFGCNNINDAVGTKRTHNVLASRKEVFPNALSYKQQREDYIVKSLKNERHFRNKLLQDGETKKSAINHSSLWANETSFGKCCKEDGKNSKCLSVNKYSRIKGG